MPTDVEIALEKRRRGYTAAAIWLATDPDNETMVFRKFNSLAALNFLCLQSEILEMEKTIEKRHQDTLHVKTPLAT